MAKILKIGTRASPLALAQAYETRDKLIAAHPDLQCEIVELKTTGDKILDRPLSEVGGKGLFTKELDEALADGRADISVHSMKDLETQIPADQQLGAVLPREDVRDAFICTKAKTLADLPDGAVVGTSSLRRQAQILGKYPHLKVVTFRGNVQTRLRKLEEGQADATLLAMAGLNRLDMTEVVASALEVDDILPAVAQGAIAITLRKGDDETQALLDPLNCEKTAIRVTAERAFLAKLDGSCRTPIAGLAEFTDDGRLRLRGMALSYNGERQILEEDFAATEDAFDLGSRIGEKVKAQMGENFFGE
ncbi:hydroxymethylbilane synthase [Curvivirga sp.]|uniref:hydroxymethylbilane synthase n=1 Tax=Curvivirga sp. TaxID=2856848 RepID=UPI003B5CD6BE